MFDLSYQEITIRLVGAVIIGSLIGYERESKRHAAGLRTNIIVCMASCVLAIIQLEASFFMAEMALENPDLANLFSIDITRLTAQIVSGIGFLGAGAIIVTRKKTVSGLTTAATVWAVAGLGIAAGMGYYFLAGVSTLILLFVLKIAKRFIKVEDDIVVLTLTYADRDIKQKVDQMLAEHSINVDNEKFELIETEAGSYVCKSTLGIYLPRNFHHHELLNLVLELDKSITEVSILK